MLWLLKISAGWTLCSSDTFFGVEDLNPALKILTVWPIHHHSSTNLLKNSSKNGQASRVTQVCCLTSLILKFKWYTVAPSKIYWHLSSGAEGLAPASLRRRGLAMANARCKPNKPDPTISNHLKNHLKSSWSNNDRITLIKCWLVHYLLEIGDWIVMDTVEALNSSLSSNGTCQLERKPRFCPLRILPTRDTRPSVQSPCCEKLWRKTIWKWCCCQNSQNMFPCGGFM